MPYYLPLRRKSCLGGRLLELECEHQNSYLIHPRHLRCWLEELSDYFIPQNGIYLSLPLMINEMRWSHFQVLLLLQEEFMEVEVQLVEGSVELAIQSGEGPSEPKILAWRRQSEPTLNFRPLLLGLCLKRCRTEARSPRLDEWPVVVHPRSQKSLTSEGSWKLER